MAVQSMLATMEGILYLMNTKLLLRRDCTLPTNVPKVLLYMRDVVELLEGVRHILEANQERAACAVCYSCDVCWRLEVLLCIPEAVEGALCLLEVLKEVSEVLKEVLEVSEVSEVPEVMRCVLLCILEAVEVWLCLTEA